MAHHVLIGFGEALPAPEVFFSLHAAGYRVSAFARSARPSLAHLPLQALHVIPAPEEDAAAAVAALERVMRGPDAPDVVMPLDDTGLWLVNAAELDPARIAGATGTPAEIALNKQRQIRAAQAAGLSVPPTVFFPEPSDVTEEAVAALPLPFIAKPCLAVELHENGMRKGQTVYETAQRDAQSLVEQITTSGPIMVQPLVTGMGQGVFGYATATGVIGWSGHRRVRCG